MRLLLLSTSLFIINFCGAQTILDAVQKSDSAMLVAAIRAGGNINEVDKYGSSPLFSCCRWGDVRMARILLQHGATVDGPRSPKGRTPLMVACAYYSGPEMCRLLIKYGADVNAKQNDGATPLMLAAMNAKLEVVQLLLAAKADPDIKDSTGLNALDYAMHADVEMLKDAMKDQTVSKEAVIEQLKAAMKQ